MNFTKINNTGDVHFKIIQHKNKKMITNKKRKSKYI